MSDELFAGIIAGVVSLCLGGMTFVSGIVALLRNNRRQNLDTQKRVDEAVEKLGDELDEFRLEYFKEYSKLELKSSTLWNLWLESTKGRGQSTGMIATNSPLQITPRYDEVVPQKVRERIDQEITNLRVINGLDAYAMTRKIVTFMLDDLLVITTQFQGVTIDEIVSAIQVLCERSLDGDAAQADGLNAVV